MKPESENRRYLVTQRDQYTALELAQCMKKHFPFLDVPEGYESGTPNTYPASVVNRQVITAK